MRRVQLLTLVAGWVFAHLGGNTAGIVLAIPLGAMAPSPSYARWRAAHERRADSA